MGDFGESGRGSPASIKDVLDRIAIEVVNDQGQSMFLRRFADAWLLANGEGKGILRPAWLAIIEKFRLEEVQEDG